jgi:hypothetical protein
MYLCISLLPISNAMQRQKIIYTTSLMLVLPCRSAWQSGEGIKKYEISSNKNAAQPTHQNIRPGE